MTSPPRQIKVYCPKCGHLYEDWRRDSINFDLDPEMDDEEYLDECSSAICPECKHKVDLGTLKIEEDSIEGEVYLDPSKPKPNPYGINIGLPDEEEEKNDWVVIGSGSLCNGISWDDPYATQLDSIESSMVAGAEIEEFEEVFSWGFLLSDLETIQDPGIELQDSHLLHELFSDVEDRDHEGGPGMSDTYIDVSVLKDQQQDVLEELKTLATRFDEWITEVQGACEEEEST